MTTEQTQMLTEFAIKHLQKEGYTVTKPEKEDKSTLIFQKGNWYNYDGRLFKIIDIDGDTFILNDDTDIELEYFVAGSDIFMRSHKASVEQVKEHLISLSREKGYKSGVKFKDADDGIERIIEDTPTSKYNAETDSYWIDVVVEKGHTRERGCLYHKGKWAFIIEHKPASVWELVDNQIQRAHFHLGNLPKRDAFDILDKAVEKWNADSKWDTDYFYPILKHTRDVELVSSNHIYLHSAFQFPDYESGKAFFDLEDATDLLRIVLGVNEKG